MNNHQTTKYTLLQINDLSFKYKTKEVLNNLNMNIPQGSIYGYLGKNGSGKTTTISLIFKFMAAKSGEIVYEGKNIYDLNHEYFKHVSLLSQPLSLYSHLTCIEQIKYMGCYYNFSPTEVEKALRNVDMYEFRDMKVRHMSAGMKQRLAIAISLLQKSELLVFDEPLNGLDPNGIHEFRGIVSNLHKQGKTILMSSHLLGEMEKTCTHVGMLDGGNLILEDSIENIQQSSTSTVELFTSDNAKCNELLLESGFLMKSDSLTNSISCEIKDDRDYAIIINALSSNAIDIYNINRERASLETIYLKKTSKSHTNA